MTYKIGQNVVFNGMQSHGRRHTRHGINEGDRGLIVDQYHDWNLVLFPQGGRMEEIITRDPLLWIASDYLGSAPCAFADG
jgi:hypothetical protein